MTETAAPEIPIEYEPPLVEEAVLVAIRGRAEEPQLRADRDALYAIGDSEEREQAFRAFHAAWFERLGLDAVVDEALREQPAVRAGAGRCLVSLARARRDEGAELFVAASADAPEPARRTLVLRLRPASLAEPDRLRPFLRRELLHVADMLDPRFGYAPRASGPDAGRLPDGLFRERYRVLWDTLVDGRLARLDWAPPGRRAERLREFAAAFPMLGDRLEEAFDRFFGGDPRTHADLVRFAAEPERALGLDRSGPHAGERCPLCGSPTHAFELDPERLPEPMRELIRRGFPGWDPADGLCRQCADLYRARVGLAAPSGVR